MRLDGEFPIATSGGVLPVSIGPVPPDARRCGGGHLIGHPGDSTEEEM